MYLCNKCISDNNVSASWFFLATPRHCPCRSHHHLNSSSATAQHQCQVTWPTKENVVTVLNNQVWGGDVGAKSARLHSFQELREGGGDDELRREVHVWIRAHPLLPSDHGKVNISWCSLDIIWNGSMLCSFQDSDVGQVGSGVDVLNLEARHGGARVRLGRINNIFQVTLDNTYFPNLTFSANLWKAGQAWSTITSGSQL